MRTKLSEKYVNEREDICKKIIEILELDNNTFLLNELDQNIEKQTNLLNLKPEIQRVFECSTISAFKPNFNCKRPYLNLVRSILRKQSYEITGIDVLIKQENGSYIKTMKYTIFRNN
jgi:hypothetical protein